MENKINQYNITDIKYKDLKGLISCFENSIPFSKISLCNFGPNVIHVRASENKLQKTKEDKKILEAQSNLILSSLYSRDKNEETNFCFTMSNDLNKIYLKRFLYQINASLNERNSDMDNMDGNNSKDYKPDIKEIMNFFELISIFTCIKDEYGDEIPITDYALSLSVEKNIKYNKLNLIQFNYEYLTQNILNFHNSNENDIFNNKNNLHIFYMLLYNLPINEISNYLYCEETKDYFSIFSEEETLDEITKRFIFINQFRLIKNEVSYKLMTINNDKENENKNKTEEGGYNLNMIRNEYDFYSILFENYLKIKENFLISNEEERRIFGTYFSILLLSEYDFIQDNLFSDIINRNYRDLKSNNDKSFTSIFSILRNILVSDMRYNFIAFNKGQIDRSRSPYLLSKISYCLGIPEDKIFYILLTDTVRENSKDKNEIILGENIIFDEESFSKNIIYFINILYLKTIDNVFEIFDSYNKKKRLVFSKNSAKPKKALNILLMRSNLIYNFTYERYLFTNNSFLAINDNFIDSNSFIINENIREHLYTNYIQEKKNYIYLKNSLTLNSNKDFPKIEDNSEYLNSIFKESLNFEEILNVYENEICGLLKLINFNDNSSNSRSIIFDSKNNLNINQFKVQFNKNLARKNKIEIIDVFNSVNQKNEIFIKVTHTFGVFLYDLNKLLNIENINNTNRNNLVELNMMPNIYKEQMIYKLLEYKPYNNPSSLLRYIQDNTDKIINSLPNAKKPIYITCLIELNKFNTLTLFDDMKINIIYVYYSNYYNYILNMNDIRKYFNQNNSNVIPKSLRNKDNYTLFKFLARKIRITTNDYITDKYYKISENNIYGNKYRNNRDNFSSLVNYIFINNKLSNSFENEKNIALMLHKHNYNLFIQLLCEKLSKSKFNYFIYAINGVKAFVKLTKIYKEKMVLSNVRNLMTDIIVDNYDIVKEEDPDNNKKNEQNFYSLTPINQKILPKIDNLDELVFDFNKEALGKMLPKLRSNLVQLKRMWRDYLYDLIYLINNVSIFSNKECTELVIEQRMINFQILLFLVHKNYNFINSESIKKFGVLVTEFTKTIANEVLRLLLELRNEFDAFLTENNDINKDLNDLKKNFENITFEKLITKRIELQNIIIQKIKEKQNALAKYNQQKMREKNSENKNWNSNGGEEKDIGERNKKYKYNNEIHRNDKSKNKNRNNSRTNNRNNNNDYDKLKEFSISKKDLNEGRLDNSFRMSKTRKQSSRAIESFNTVNRTNQLQLTYKNTSGNDTPKTQQNFNYSEFDDMKPENDRIKNNNNYEYKYDNVAFRNIDESTIRNNVRAKIYYSNSPNEDSNNYRDNNQNKYSQNNSDRNKYSDRERDPNNRNMNYNNNENDDRKYSTPSRANNNDNMNNRNNINNFPNNYNDPNYGRYNQNNNRNNYNNNPNKTDNSQNYRNNYNNNPNYNQRNNSYNQNPNEDNNNMGRNSYNNKYGNNNNNLDSNNMGRNNDPNSRPNQYNGINRNLSKGNYIPNNNDNNNYNNRDNNDNNNNDSYSNRYRPRNSRTNNNSQNLDDYENQNKPNIINISNNNSNNNLDDNKNSNRNRNTPSRRSGNDPDNSNKANDDDNYQRNNQNLRNLYNDNRNNNNNNNSGNNNNDDPYNQMNNNYPPDKNAQKMNNYNRQNPNENNNDNNRNNDERFDKNNLNQMNYYRGGQPNNNNPTNNNLGNNNENEGNQTDRVNNSPSFSNPNSRVFEPKSEISYNYNNYPNKNRVDQYNRNNDNDNEKDPNNLYNNRNNDLGNRKDENNPNSGRNSNYRGPNRNGYNNRNNNYDPNDKNNNSNNVPQYSRSNVYSNAIGPSYNNNRNPKYGNNDEDNNHNNNNNYNNYISFKDDKNNYPNNNDDNYNNNNNDGYNNGNDDKNNNKYNNPNNSNYYNNRNNQPNQNNNYDNNRNAPTLNNNNYDNNRNRPSSNSNYDNNRNRPNSNNNNYDNNRNRPNSNNNNYDNNRNSRPNSNNNRYDNNRNNRPSSNNNSYDNNRNNTRYPNNNNYDNNRNSRPNSNNNYDNNRNSYRNPNNNNYNNNRNNYNNPINNNYDNNRNNNDNYKNRNNDRNRRGNNRDNNSIPFISDEDLKNINKTLSDINMVDTDRNNPVDYLTYPFNKKNEKPNVKNNWKEIPNKIKRKINLNIIKNIKEREIQRIKDNNDVNIPSLKELERRIKEIRNEINAIEISDMLFSKIEDLHIKDQNNEDNNGADYKLFNMAEQLNKEFYDDIDLRLQMAEEAINNLGN